MWRGALLLCDLIVERGERLCAPGEVVVELGGGVGLPSLLAAACVRRRVLLTDGHAGALRLARANVARNADVLRGEVRVRRRAWGVADAPGGGADDEGAWSPADSASLARAGVFLAADVVYDARLTALFFDELSAAMRCGDALFLSIELRVNFDAGALAPVATGYRALLERLCVSGEHFADAWARAPCAACDAAAARGAPVAFAGRRLSLAALAQRSDYERVPALEMWELWRLPGVHAPTTLGQATALAAASDEGACGALGRHLRCALAHAWPASRDAALTLCYAAEAAAGALGAHEDEPWVRVAPAACGDACVPAFTRAPPRARP